MIRFVTAAVLALSATAAAAQTPALRPTILVTSDLVRIGDLVEHAAPSKAQIAIFRAPDLGETGTVPAARVIAALRPHDVVAVDTGGLSQVSVTRASRVVGSTEMRSRIAELLAERLRVADAANVALILDAPVQAIHLDPSDMAPLTPVRVSLERGGRFDVIFKSDGDKQIRITGTASEAHDTLVATRLLARGEILRGSDVAVEKRPKAEIQGEPMRDPSAAIGMALQQPLRPGQPIRQTDIVKPQLVKRGEPVVIHYSVPGIALTMRGKAEESGALGDMVSIVNVQSKRTVQGVVSGPAQVTMTSFAPRISNAVANLESTKTDSAMGAGRSRSE